MRRFNVWAAQVVGVQMVKVSQYQTQRPHMVNRFVRKLAKLIFVDHRRVAGLFDLHFECFFGSFFVCLFVAVATVVVVANAMNWVQF